MDADNFAHLLTFQGPGEYKVRPDVPDVRGGTWGTGDPKGYLEWAIHNAAYIPVCYLHCVKLKYVMLFFRGVQGPGRYTLKDVRTSPSCTFGKFNPLSELDLAIIR